PHAFPSRPLHRLAHRLLVRLIRTWRRNRHLHQRQARRFSLHVQQPLAHRVHRHALKRLVHRRQQRRHLEIAAPPHHFQRPRAILAAAPGKPSLRPRTLPHSVAIPHSRSIIPKKFAKTLQPFESRRGGSKGGI